MTIKKTIKSYRKRRTQLMPLILGIAAILLVAAGIVIVVTSMNGGGLARLFASPTPTATITSSPTNTLPPTETPTITTTPTETPTGTPSGPYTYVVREGETLTSIIKAHGLSDTANALIIIYLMNPEIDPTTGFITVGQTINLPPPNYPLPTPTPLPTGLAAGARITYMVLPGDSLGLIANKFNSTVDAIVAANKKVLSKGASTVLYPGQVLTVPIHLVTPVPTKAGTATPTATATATP
jgi:LysM repeat protein